MRNSIAKIVLINNNDPGMKFRTFVPALTCNYNYIVRFCFTQALGVVPVDFLKK